MPYSQTATIKITLTGVYNGSFWFCWWYWLSLGMAVRRVYRPRSTNICHIESQLICLVSVRSDPFPLHCYHSARSQTHTETGSIRPAPLRHLHKVNPLKVPHTWPVWLLLPTTGERDLLRVRSGSKPVATDPMAAHCDCSHPSVSAVNRSNNARHWRWHVSEKEGTAAAHAVRRRGF